MKSVAPLIVAVLALATSASAGGKKQFADTPGDTNLDKSGAKKEALVSEPRSLASLLGHIAAVEKKNFRSRELKWRFEGLGQMLP